jgi:hypothetical protein
MELAAASTEATERRTTLAEVALCKLREFDPSYVADFVSDKTNAPRCVRACRRACARRAAHSWRPIVPTRTDCAGPSGGGNQAPASGRSNSATKGGRRKLFTDIEPSSAPSRSLSMHGVLCRLNELAHVDVVPYGDCRSQASPWRLATSCRFPYTTIRPCSPSVTRPRSHEVRSPPPSFRVFRGAATVVTPAKLATKCLRGFMSDAFAHCCRLSSRREGM